MSSPHLPAIVGESLESLMALANQLQRADGMVPKHMVGNPGKILAAILAGRELGVGPMASLRSFHVVEGKPVADYSFWVARLKSAGYRLEWLTAGAEKVTLRLTAPDGAQHVETWDKARAITAGLWNGKDNWKKYPETMLKARCVTSAGRAFAGEVMFSCYEDDEADEIRVEAKVTSSEPEPKRGIAGLADKLQTQDAAKPQPFSSSDMVGDALAAIHEAETTEQLKAIRDRIVATKFAEDAGKRIHAALVDRVKEIKAIEAEAQEAADAKAERESLEAEGAAS